MISAPVSCNTLNLISALVYVSFMLNSATIWRDSFYVVSSLMLVRSVRMVRFWSRTPRTWPGCVASCVGMFDPFLVRIDAAWHCLATVEVGYESVLHTVVSLDITGVRTEVAHEEIIVGNGGGPHILHIRHGP